jgi:pyrimidine-specific ribonucleoside hydrolase
MSASFASAVWIDTDPAVGEPGADVDDGFAILQALRSPELQFVGISTVFGNAPCPTGHRIAHHLLELAEAPDIPLYAGATGAQSLGRPSEASRALANELRERSLRILALGPLTNIATVLLNEPELAEQVDEIVFVGGRRPGQRFTVAGNGPLPDFNLECDPAAAAHLLDTDVPLALAGFEVSTHATLTADHLDRLAAGPPAARWLAQRSHAWISWWREHLGFQGFHPFDTLAVAALATPELLEFEHVAPALTPNRDGGTELHAALGQPGRRQVRYATTAAESFIEDLIRRLLS